MSITGKIQLQTPTKETFNKKKWIIGPTRKDVHRISYKKSIVTETLHSRNEKPSCPWTVISLNYYLLLFSNGLSKQPSHLSPFSLYLYSPLFVGLACGFCYNLLVPNCNSLLFPNKPVFAGKITFIFKVNKGKEELTYHTNQLYVR